MKQTILKHGDLVKYFKPSEVLDQRFELNKTYVVESKGRGKLAVNDTVLSLHYKITDNCYHFKLVSNKPKEVSPLLPRGIKCL